MNKVAVVTGGSSGIGKATATALAANGFTVFEFSRRDIPQEGVNHVFADITNSETVKNAVNSVIEAAGRIDLLINNAGAGISGAVEFTDDSSVEFLVNVLFCGTDKVTRACLPHLRASGGRIVNVSSAAAMLPVPFQTYYSAMKSAINAYTLALANEVKRFGVTVCAVMPGDTNTGFTSARSKVTAGDDIYGGAVSRSVGKMEKDETHGVPAEKVARAIYRASTRKHPRPLTAVGADYKLLCGLSKMLPYSLVNKIIAMLYAK